MMAVVTAEELAALAESVDVEFKAAQGRDGNGGLPEDFWRSYAAMANGDGGVIWLGVKEKPRGVFSAVGLVDIEKIRKALWDTLNNGNKISVNLLSEEDVQPVSVDGKTVLRVAVPRASRQRKPVHLGTNPFGGTYLRRYEGDYQADDETVRRMLAERIEDSRDEKVLKGFGIEDIDMDTVSAYRNRFSAVKPGHVWADLPVSEFLDRIGAFGKNREEGYYGPRLAGLLMFGRAEVIRDALPNYMVDYQERPEPKTERRWIDRLIPDGSWSGNVYDFFRRVYQKLTADLKVPFQLQDGQRIEDTPVHEALREALVNTLIHADFSGRVSILVVKRPDLFGFRNPGLMRIPIAKAIGGGTSDCRNRRLQTMFQLVGYGDHAGSGLPKIYYNWEGQQWRRPVLYESREPEQTLMELRMASLLPPEVVADLESHLGERFRALSRPELLALVAAATEGQVNHSRLREISADHPTDITKMLGRMVRDGLLIPDGVGRGMIYYLPWSDRRLASGFDEADLPSLGAEFGAKGQELGAKGQELGAKGQELGAKGQELRVPVFESEEELGDALRAELKSLAAAVRDRGKVKAPVMTETLRSLCSGRYLSLKVLSALLGREPESLRRKVLNPLIESGFLSRFSASANDPRQAYTWNMERDR